VAINKEIFQGDVYLLCVCSPYLICCGISIRVFVLMILLSFIYFLLEDLKLYAKSSEDMQASVNTVRVFSSNIKMVFGFVPI